MSLISNAREKFHADLLGCVLSIDSHGIPTNADKDSPLSRNVAIALAESLMAVNGRDRLPGQSSGNLFEGVVKRFVEDTFLMLGGLRPGTWAVAKVGNRSRLSIAGYDQYSHLESLATLAKQNAELAVALGADYVIAPDVVVIRHPESDEFINDQIELVDMNLARLTPLRRTNNPLPTLHASISCKWTLRSDRAQNAKSEALNLVRNRKGKLPHVLAVTGEPLPARIASLALGTGDLDCVYHVALPELLNVLEHIGDATSRELMNTMVEGKRVRDIADLPLDISI